MTTGIIAVLPISGNKEKGEKEEKKETGEKQQKNQNQQNQQNQSLFVEYAAYNPRTKVLVEYPNAKKMINRLLTRDRVILVPKQVPSFTVKELARELNITPFELKKLCIFSWYKKLARHINLPLVRLYCGTKFCDSVFSATFSATSVTDEPCSGGSGEGDTKHW